MYNNGCKYKILNNHKDLEQFKKDNTVDMYTVLPYFNKIVIFFDYIKGRK